MKLATPKQPAKSMASSFARYVDDSGHIRGWHLFRRSSVDRRLFVRSVHTTYPTLTRAEMAAELWQARIVLRSVVDHYDLQKLGVTH